MIESLLYYNVEGSHRRLEPEGSSFNFDLVEILEVYNGLGILVVSNLLLSRCSSHDRSNASNLTLSDAQQDFGAYFLMSYAMGLGVSPSMSLSTLGGIVTLLYD